MSNPTPTGYILGISRGHNAGACLLKDGKIVFSIEEERLTRAKYDGGPYACMMRVKEYTDKLDYIFISHTQSLESTAGKVDYMGENVYTGLARKMGLIERKNVDLHNHPQVIDLSHQHHKIHAACAFYRSGFTDAVALVVDGAGSVKTANFGTDPVHLWEVETIIDCAYPAKFKTLYKHSGCREPIINNVNYNESSEHLGEEGTHISIKTGHAGITKTYEAVTEYTGFQSIEAGKTMGLFPYGEPNDKIPKLFTKIGALPISDRNVIIPRYPNGAMVNSEFFEELNELPNNGEDPTTLKSRRDLAYAVQTETQDMVLDLIIKSAELSGKKQVVLSGGYALNCVANYYYLDKLKEEGIELFVEPISNDGGTAIGVALWGYYEVSQSEEKLNGRDIYLGFEYSYSENDIVKIAKQYGALVEDATDDLAIELMTNKNIVACFQGRSENGPRALGNRSLMFDPTFKDGKDFVNLIKRREYFRPFAGSILAEDVHEWFDLRGMEDSPHMMYAVSCKEGVEEKIPSIIHVDGSCRIQTVSEEDNPLYYRIIKAFKEKTGVPIIFNTSFNLGGEPLVETLEDSLWTLQQSDIQYLYLPEYGKMLTVPNLTVI
jgi:carbamoyltransferase